MHILGALLIRNVFINFYIALKWSDSRMNVTPRKCNDWSQIYLFCFSLQRTKKMRKKMTSRNKCWIYLMKSQFHQEQYRWFHWMTTKQLAEKAKPIHWMRYVPFLQNLSANIRPKLERMHCAPTGCWLRWFWTDSYCSCLSCSRLLHHVPFYLIAPVTMTFKYSCPFSI